MPLSCATNISNKSFILIVISRRKYSKYSNAEESDLWEALTEQIRETPASLLPGNVTVKQVMDTWMLQNGYPVVTVTRNYDDGSATISQVSICNTGVTTIMLAKKLHYHLEQKKLGPILQ
jgi:aminopeptidase N